MSTMQELADQFTPILRPAMKRGRRAVLYPSGNLYIAFLDGVNPQPQLPDTLVNEFCFANGMDQTAKDEAFGFSRGLDPMAATELLLRLMTWQAALCRAA